MAKFWRVSIIYIQQLRATTPETNAEVEHTVTRATYEMQAITVAQPSLDKHKKLANAILNFNRNKSTKSIWKSDSIMVKKSSTGQATIFNVIYKKDYDTLVKTFANRKNAAR